MPPTRIVIAALAITIGAAAPVAHAGPGKPPAVLASLPEDTTMLASIDLKKVTKAPIASDALDMVKQQAADQLAQMKAAGIDVEKDVTKVFVALAGAGLTDTNNARLKILVAEGKLKIDASGITDPSKTYEGVTYYSTPNADVALINKRLYVVSDGHMPDLIDVIKGKAKNATKSTAAKKLRAAIGATTQTNAGWVVGVVSDTDRAAMGTQGADLDWFSASAALRTDAVDVAVRLGMTSPDKAKTMADTATAQIGQAQAAMSQIGLADLAKSLNIAANGSVVAMAATVTKKEIGTITNLMQMMTSSMASQSPPPPPTGSGAKPVTPAPTPAPSTTKSQTQPSTTTTKTKTP